MGKRGIWDIYPDMNGDGKHDILDFFILDDKLRRSEEKEKEASRYRRLRDEECDWRNEIEDDTEFDIDPEEYETREEYEEALKDAARAFLEEHASREREVRSEYEEGADEVAELFSDDIDAEDNVSVDVPLAFSVEASYPGKEQLEQIKLSDHPNKRTYNAAYALCELEHGDPYIPSDTTKEEEIERYRFILSQSCIAARYLTQYDGYIYVQAIKEHFDLPIDVPDEDNEVKTSFPDLYMELAEEDVSLAIDVWAWCIKEFGAYQKYMRSCGTLYNQIIYSIEDYPESFLDRLIDRLGADQAFRCGLLTESPDAPYSVSDFVVRALNTGRENIAREIFTAAMQNPAAKGKWKEDVLERMISDCSDWEELETMEAFRKHIFPLAKELPDKRIQRVFPRLERKVEEYIEYVEGNADKYRYSRRFAWRTKYKNSPLCDVDPLDNETEQDYLEAVQRRKYAWRRNITPYKLRYADPAIYETAEEFEAAFQAAIDEEERINSLNEQADSDRSIYKFCKVELREYPNNAYYYFLGTLALHIGDRVIVPFGRDNKELYGTVVSVGECYGSAFPCAIDCIKYVKKQI